jgi:SAM-dependent methyltransferase
VSFGYVPRSKSNKGFWWNVVFKLAYRFFGQPDFLRRLQAPLLMKFMDCQPGDIILDIGCGKGHFTQQIARTGSAVVGLDKSPLRETEACFPFVQADTRHLPFKNQAVDKMVLSSVIQMVKEDVVIMSECRRVLKDTGTLTLSVPTGYRYIPLLYLDNFVSAALRKLFRLPDHYGRFLSELNLRFKVQGKGYYSKNALIHLLESQGFLLNRACCCPRQIGTILYETALCFFWASGKRDFVYALSFLLYPLGLFDTFSGKKNAGCELIVRAMKDSRGFASMETPRF